MGFKSGCHIKVAGGWKGSWEAGSGGDKKVLGPFRAVVIRTERFAHKCPTSGPGGYIPTAAMGVP